MKQVFSNFWLGVGERLRRELLEKRGDKSFS